MGTLQASSTACVSVRERSGQTTSPERLPTLDNDLEGAGAVTPGWPRFESLVWQVEGILKFLLVDLLGIARHKPGLSPGL